MSNTYIIQPTMRGEVRTWTAEDKSYPVGSAFEYDDGIEKLREEVPDHEIIEAKKEDLPAELETVVETKTEVKPSKSGKEGKS